MKHCLFCLPLCFLILVGCTSIDHPISGKQYVCNLNNDAIYITFHENGKFERDYMTKKFGGGYEHDKTTHFKWEIDGNKISVYHDKSTYWKSHVRGTLWETGVYNPSDNTVILGGTTYEDPLAWTNKYL